MTRYWRGTLMLLIVLSLLLLPNGHRSRAIIGAPQLVSPANGVETTGNPNDTHTERRCYPPLGIPTFAWEAVSGATKYKLQVSTSGTFGTDDIVLEQETVYTSYTPTGVGLKNGGFTNGTTFFWRVSAWDQEEGAWSDPSEVWRFTRHWGYVPNITSPTGGGELGLTPTFKWDAVLGARYYQIQVSTDSGFPQGGLEFEKNTPMTSYAPTTPLSNDQNYYCRVRAYDKAGNAGEWSAVQSFRLRWGYGANKVTLLTPQQGSNNVGIPLFSWTPVRGAARYNIRVNKYPSPDTSPFQVNTTVAQTSYTFDPGGNWTLSAGTLYYWHVQPCDDKGNCGEWASSYFQTCSDTTSPCLPQMYYPPYYYERPVNNDTFVDPTVAVPTFMWGAMPSTVTQMITYHVQTASDVNFNHILWEMETENLSATPITTTNPFTDGEVVYWRIRATRSDGSWGPWSERWQTRIDSGLLMTPTAAPPQLLRPTYQEEQRPGSTISHTFSYEALDHWPNFEWKPVQGATRYRIQISRAPDDFSALVDEAVTLFTNYTPPTKFPWGTYYWRVRAENGSGPIGDWSAVSRLIVERPYQLVSVVIDGHNDFPTSTLAASDPTSDTEPLYDLHNLYISYANGWNIGFDATTTTSTVRYGLYIDTNHGDYLGASSDPLSSAVSDTIKAHYPEAIVYWDVNGGTVTTATLYTWDGSQWQHDDLAGVYVGGKASYSRSEGFAEMAIPQGELFFQTGIFAYSPSFILFSADPSTGQVKDTVPPNSGAVLKDFFTDGLAPAPIYPPANTNDADGNVVHRYTPLFAWHYQEYSIENAIDVARDYGFTDHYSNYSNREVPRQGMLYGRYNAIFAPKDIFEDNPTYYWRMSVVGLPYGQGVRFSKLGFTPSNLQFDDCLRAISGTIPYVNRTPTFRWDPVEGAAGYRVEITGREERSCDTTLNTCTFDYTLPNGSYQWRVTARYYGNKYGTPSEWVDFVKVYTTVKPISPLTADQVTETVIFRWEPVEDAAYYELQVATDENFSRDMNSYQTYNTTFTPQSVPSAFREGLQEFYWRVRLIDGSGRPGDWIWLNLDPYPFDVYLPLVLKAN